MEDQRLVLSWGEQYDRKMALVAAVDYVKKTWEDTSDYWVPFIQNELGGRSTPEDIKNLIIELDRSFFPEVIALLNAAPVGLTAANPCHGDDGRFCEVHGTTHSGGGGGGGGGNLLAAARAYQRSHNRFKRFPLWQLNLAVAVGSILYHVAPTV